MLQEKNKTRVRARKTITSGEGARTHTTARTCTPVLDCNRNSSLCLSFASYACFLAQIHDVPLLVPNVKKNCSPTLQSISGQTIPCSISHLQKQPTTFIGLGLQLVFDRRRFAALTRNERCCLFERVFFGSPRF
jgi:hypothetical protein